MADFLTAAVGGRLSMLISGGAGAGKTTLLGSLARLIPERERIVTIEETAELGLERAGVVSLETPRPTTTITAPARESPSRCGKS